MEHDHETQAFIRRWQPPAMPSGIDERMMARSLASRRPWWRRRLELRIAVPAPVVALVTLGLFVSGTWWGISSGRPRPSAGTWEGWIR